MVYLCTERPCILTISALNLLYHTMCYLFLLQLGETSNRGEDAIRAAQGERDKVERQNQQLSDYEAEINLLRRRLESLESDRDRDKKQITQLTDSLNRARMVSTQNGRRMI